MLLSVKWNESKPPPNTLALVLTEDGLVVMSYEYYGDIGEWEWRLPGGVFVGFSDEPWLSMSEIAPKG